MLNSSKVKIEEGKRSRDDDVFTKKSLKKIRLQKEPQSTTVSIPEFPDFSVKVSPAVCSVSTRPLQTPTIYWHHQELT